MKKDEKYWKEHLSEEEFQVTRKKGTEAPFTGKYDKCFDKGRYNCVCCGEELFVSDNKFDSGHGWPSFTEGKSLKTLPDHSHGMQRVEVLCSKCDGHLGHVFEEEKGQRFCINSAALKFKKEE